MPYAATKLSHLLTTRGLQCFQKGYFKTDRSSVPHQTLSISVSATLEQDGTTGNKDVSNYHCTYLQITL